MAQAEQTRHEQIKHYVILSFIGASLIGTATGYLLFYGCHHVVLGFLVAYAAMFGFNKLKEALTEPSKQ